MAACRAWPAGSVPPSYGQPVESDVPVLLLSGILDPVVPPKWGDLAASGLPNSLHLVLPDAHHLSGECYESVLRTFFQNPSLVTRAEDFNGKPEALLDGDRPVVGRQPRSWTRCTEEIRLPPFEIPVR
jgi:fermentation-respiration switch protein FrsA (DUF1100 family)